MEMLAMQPFHYFGAGDEGRYIKAGETIEIRDDLVESLLAAGYIAAPGTELVAPPARTRRKRG